MLIHLAARFTTANAPVKLFFPLPPRAAPGQRKNVCDKKGRSTRKKGEISDYIGRGKEKIKWSEDRGNQKSDVPWGARGDGGRTIWPAHKPH